MLQKLASQAKWLGAACCVAALLSACSSDKEETATKTVVETTVTTTQAPAETEATPANPKIEEPALVETTQATGSNDPFSYCNTVGNADKPDANYTGEALPESLIQAMVKNGTVTEEMLENGPLREPGYLQWRCMDNKVYACITGANIPCEAKADTSTEPNEGMQAYCQEAANQNTDFIPAAATGRTTVYNWSCKDGKPQMGEQASKVDAQGYPVDFWMEVQPVELTN